MYSDQLILVIITSLPFVPNEGYEQLYTMLNLRHSKSIVKGNTPRYFSIFYGNVTDLIQYDVKPHVFKWGSVSSQRLFMEDLAKKLNITSQRGWYKVTSNMFRQYGGNELLQFYKYSPIKLFRTVFPEYLSCY